MPDSDSMSASDTIMALCRRTQTLPPDVQAELSAVAELLIAIAEQTPHSVPLEERLESALQQRIRGPRTSA